MARDGSILVLKTGEALAPVKAARGDFHQWIAKGMGVAEDHLTVASVYTGDPLPDPASITGVVVTGSPLMVTDREDWSEASAAWLARIVEARLYRETELRRFLAQVLRDNKQLDQTRLQAVVRDVEREFFLA